jgi:hypothetical protein
MKALSETITAGAQSIPKTKRNGNLSADGKWRSFPKVPNLLQCVVAGTYYARRKANGKPVRDSLETDVFITAKFRLPDHLKELSGFASGLPRPCRGRGFPTEIFQFHASGQRVLAGEWEFPESKRRLPVKAAAGRKGFQRVFCELSRRG